MVALLICLFLLAVAGLYIVLDKSRHSRRKQQQASYQLSGNTLGRFVAHHGGLTKLAVVYDFIITDKVMVLRNGDTSVFEVPVDAISKISCDVRRVLVHTKDTAYKLRYLQPAPDEISPDQYSSNRRLAYNSQEALSDLEQIASKLSIPFESTAK